MRALLAFLTLALLTGCASLKLPEKNLGEAIAAGALDCATTGTFLALGAAVEANPLGPVAACVLKPLSVAYANSKPEPERTQALHATTALWTGASVNNGAYIVAKLLGVKVASAIPPLLGIGVAYYLWNEGADEREFAGICAIEKRRDPRITTCVFKPQPTP